MQYRKVTLLLKGEAEAYDATKESEDPACKYIGKLEKQAQPTAVEQDSDKPLIPTRGSTIGGSAIADPVITDSPYPFHVVACRPTEWIEWDLTELTRLLDTESNASIRAAFYSLLYIELLSTLNKDRSVRLLRKRQESDDISPPPRVGQLVSLSAFVAIPFVGFGFADNFIMIIAGDAIDAQIGRMLSLSTLACAGLGNWISDVVGLGLGDVIERNAAKMGITDGGLTAAQEKMRISKLVNVMSKIIGISIGCFFGMVPLLWIEKKEV